MKSFIVPSFIFFIVISGCGPAAEDRQLMHSRAKVFQDSIANVLRTAMAEAEVPGNTPPPPPPVDSSAQSLRPLPSPQVK